MKAFAPVQSRLYCYVASLVPRPADAEDLFQKSLLTAWEKRAKFDRTGDLLSWMCGIARNHLRHFLRDQHRPNLMLDADVVDELAVKLLAEESQFRRRQEALDECLEKLPVNQRELVVRYYSSRNSAQGISESSGARIEAIYKTLQRIREALHECILRTLSQGCRS